MQCQKRPCFTIEDPTLARLCHCPILNEETLIVIGAAALCLLLLLLVMGMCQCNQDWCAEFRTTFTRTDHTEALLEADLHPPGPPPTSRVSRAQTQPPPPSPPRRVSLRRPHGAVQPAQPRPHLARVGLLVHRLHGSCDRLRAHALRP